MQIGQLTGFTIDLNDAGVALFTFTSAESLATLTRATKRDLIESIVQAQMDDRVRVLVFIGTGDSFLAGDDLDSERQVATSPTLVAPLPYNGSHPIRTYESLRSCSQLLNYTLYNTDKMTVAAVNGYALQSGLSLALACDFRIASTAAKLGSATLRFGYLPDEGGHWLLNRYLGEAGALDFILRNRIVGADEALALGLVNRVIAADRLQHEALELARELAAGPQVALRLAKKAVRNATTMSFDQSLDDIATKTAVGDHHPDAVEGAAAFRERRAPKFNAWLDRA